MAAQQRVLRRRIRTLQSTRKITKAMELIAASRIAKAQARRNAARPYAEELTRALSAVLQDKSLKHPMLTGVENPQRAGVVIVTSDRGLAGGYNANALRAANELTRKLEGDGREVVRYVIGRKGAAFFNFRRIQTAGTWTGFSEQPAFTNIRDLTEKLEIALAATSENDSEDVTGLDELYLVYTQFKNSVTQTPVTEQLAPVKDIEGIDDSAEGDESPNDQSDEKQENVLYEFEPEPAELISALLPRYISARIFSGLLESAASESAARRNAMKSASDNATDLIRTFTRLANQARQAEITQEISEIVGGADALAASGSDE
jgi:F-type H+-transporting ATPase subunit gamma